MTVAVSRGERGDREPHPSQAAATFEARTPHRAWIEVDHAAIVSNLAALRRRSRPEQDVIGVVKANAYGHGDVEVASTLVRAGVKRLAVATLDEALRLRAAGLSLPVLVLFEVGDLEAARAVAAELELTVYTPHRIAAVSSAAAAVGTRTSVHLKIDTGLGRQGLDPGEATAAAAAIVRDPQLRLAGTFTHLAVPEDEAYTEVQLQRFARALDWMRGAGIDPGIVHVAGTGAILAGVGAFADAIRPGLGLYGMTPDWAPADEAGLRPSLTLRALPLRVFDLAVGQPIGYGLRFRADRPSRIATLGIGYGDGWPRAHANNGFVLVRGQRAPMVGAISMDALTVDVTDVDGAGDADEFVLIGEQGGERITADEVAQQRRTINYEVTTALRRRLPRIHRGAHEVSG